MSNQKIDASQVSFATGGAGVSLEVAEVDGVPDVSGVTKIVVPNGTLADDGGGQVTIQTNNGSFVSVDLTNQGADIAPTNLSGTFANGLYNIVPYLLCTTADGTAGQVHLVLNWNDGVTNRSYAGLDVDLADTANFDDFSVAVYVGDSNPPQYSTGHTGIYGTSKYALHLRVQKL